MKRQEIKGKQGNSTGAKQHRKGKYTIATRKQLSVKVDYLNIVFDTVKAEEVLSMLNIPESWFSQREGSIAYKEYQTLYQFGEIKVYSNARETLRNPLGLGAYLALGGKGCRELETFVGSFGLFLQRLVKAFGGNSFHVTRIDLAIDDTNEKPFFTIEQLIRKADRGEYISASKKHKAIKSVDGKEVARTLYIGVGKSQISFRFYDKDKEVLGKGKHLPNGITSWKRTEIQLRGDKAHKLALSLKGQNLEEITCGLLKHSLRFVVWDKNQTNKSRLKTCQFWERFLGSVKPLKIEIRKEDSNLADTRNWLKFGGALAAVKAFQFLKEHEALGNLGGIEGSLDTALFSPELAHKIVSHLMETHREDLIPHVYGNTRNMIPGKGGDTNE